MVKDVYLAGAARTAIGAFNGAFAGLPAPELGARAVRAVLERTGLAPEKVEEVIFGNVLSAGLGQNVARQVGVKAGLPVATGGITVNKVCGSGLKSVMLAAQAIQCSDASVLMAGGTENMSRAPYLLDKARSGYRLGHGELTDCVIKDGLWDVYNDMHMGRCGDRAAAKYGFGREDQDDFAVASFTRARKAVDSGAFKQEILPVEIKGRKETVTVVEDESPQKFNEGKMRSLRAAFGEDGTVTAGNASSLNDGAAAVLVLDEAGLKANGIKPQAKVLGYASYAREPEWFTLAPIGAMDRLVKELGWKVEDVDLWEINEAFSVVPMAAMKDLAIPHEKVNIHGGAVALGHPIGASGARVLVTLIHALQQTGGKRGIASLCIGGGEGVALALELC